MKSSSLWGGLPTLLAGALLGCGHGAPVDEARADDALRPRKVALVPVQARTIVRTLRVPGALEAWEAADLAVASPGIVVETPVDVGDRVEAGGVVLRLDARAASLQTAQARAALEQVSARLGPQAAGQFDTDALPEVRAAQAAAEVARANLERAERLVQAGALSPQAIDQLRAGATQATQAAEIARSGARQVHAGVAAARSAQQLASKLLSDAILRAPFAGTIARRNISVGEFAAPGMPVLSLVSDGPLRCLMDIPEAEIGAVHAGALVRLEVPAFPDRVFEGTVSRISPALDAASRSLRVEATVADATGSLRPGMFGTARIAMQGTAETLVLPLAAIRSLAGVHKVFLAKAGHLEERIVQLGEPLGDSVEVRGELHAGDRVAAEDLNRLADGVPLLE